MEIEDIVYTYGDTLYRVAYSYIKDEQAAEEIVQDVFMKFYQTKDQFKGEAQLKTYLTRMTINRSYDYLRSWKSKRHTFLELFVRKQSGADKSVIEMTESETILRAVFQLPIKYREAIVLHYYEDLQVKEIAQLLDISESTIKSRIQRGRKYLKETLQQTDWEVLKDE